MIRFGQERDVNIITTFQQKMAWETQKMKLDHYIVTKAVDFLIKQKQEYGIYLLYETDRVVGSLLLTFQNNQKWWIQSVYIQQNQRHQGKFTSLFKQAVALAKQKNIKSIKLYAETQNQTAKIIYMKLGMNILSLKMYSYDFVYGKASNINFDSTFKAELIKNKNDFLQNFSLKQTKNVLTGEFFNQSQCPEIYAIYHDQKFCGISKIFNQYSDWRFGLMKYLRQVYLLQNFNLQQIINALIHTIIKNSSLKIAAFRVLYQSNNNIHLQNGHLQNYDILQLRL